MRIYNILKGIVNKIGELKEEKANAVRGSIGDGSDLNDYHTHGWYWVKNDEGITVANRPSASYGALEVINFINSTNCLQRYTCFNSDVVYERMYANSKWYDWKQISGFGNIAIASGTMTTKAWAHATQTTTWTAPYDGVYIMTVRITTQEDTANTSAYKMFRWYGNVDSLGMENTGLYYRGTTDGSQYGINANTWSFAVKAKAGQTVSASMWTGVVFKCNVWITGVRVGNN